MLANPIVFPMCSGPGVWLAAVGALVLEVATIEFVLGRFSLDVSAIRRRFLGAQLMTWIPFLFVVQLASLTACFVCWLVALELIVVIVEIPLIVACGPGQPHVWIGWRPALVASIAGNAVSAVLSVPFLWLSLAK